MRDAELQASGSATVNGKPGYRFTLSAGAGANARDGRGRFGIQIWHAEPGSTVEVVDYDNLRSGHSQDAGNAGTAVQYGGIVTGPV